MCSPISDEDLKIAEAVALQELNTSPQRSRSGVARHSRSNSEAVSAGAAGAECEGGDDTADLLGGEAVSDGSAATTAAPKVSWMCCPVLIQI